MQGQQTDQWNVAASCAPPTTHIKSLGLNPNHPKMSFFIDVVVQQQKTHKCQKSTSIHTNRCQYRVEEHWDK